MLPVVAVGGTFDHLHKGHEALLLKSFEVGESVVIGITSDSLAKQIGKKDIQPFGERVNQVNAFLKKNALTDRAHIIPLDDVFGPLVDDPTVCGVVVTPETIINAEKANSIRLKKKLPPLTIFVQDFVLAADGKPISSTRIRNKEIDVRGNLITK